MNIAVKLLMFDDVLSSIRFSSSFEGEEIDLGDLKHKGFPLSNSNFKGIGCSKGSIS